MPSYRTPDREDLDLLREALDRWHPDLALAEVQIGLLYALAKRDGDGCPVGPALKLHGQPAAAIVKINSQKDRVEGKPDATISLDFDSWPDRSHEEKLAILDHELEHLIVVRDEANGIVTDDASRPKLRMREHDLVVGGFRAVVERHKIHAIEAQAYRDVHNQFVQMQFTYG